MSEFEENLNNTFGDIDLELLDLVLKGFFREGQRLLDAGCGEGRNLIYFLQKNFDVYGIDSEKSSVDLVKYMFRNFCKDPNNVRQEEISNTTFSSGMFDAIICSRVLHFSETELHFLKSWEQLIRMLKSGGILYLSMDSMIGFANKVTKLSDGKWQFQDGKIRFLLDENLLEKMQIEKSFEFIGPMKTIHYNSDHCQTIFSLKKYS
ncbi:MAG: class I SAM-dependent methyltransferase [Bacteroidota bacterium]